jgi:hypothetical protein
MQTKIYPRFYQLFQYKNLFINKRVAGFYIPQQSAQLVVRKRGLYYQALCIDSTSYLFVYKDFTLPTFLPFFSKSKLRLYLDDTIKKLQDEIGVNGDFDADAINMLLSTPIKWVGIPKSNGNPDACDSVSIIDPSGKESVYLKESGKPILIPYFEVYFRPLGEFNV